MGNGCGKRMKCRPQYKVSERRMELDGGAQQGYYSPGAAEGTYVQQGYYSPGANPQPRPQIEDRNFGRDAIKMECHFCHQLVTTDVIIAKLCICAPCCTPDFKDYIHCCPRCGQVLGRSMTGTNLYPYRYGGYWYHRRVYGRSSSNGSSRF